LGVTDESTSSADAGKPGDDAYVKYVSEKIPWLRRVAFLMCQDWHRADDLVQVTITSLYAHWRRASKVENLDGYVRRMLVNVYLAEQRTSWWRRVVPTGTNREAADETASHVPDLAVNLDLAAALAGLPPRQRAAVVLRHYCDLSLEEAAEVLSCSTGTVKSQTARGLAALRIALAAGGAR
jgi:RNA polymerase sigma-70 factor (sigma-E family)